LVPVSSELVLAEKPRPNPPASPARKAWPTSAPSRLTTRPLHPGLAAEGDEALDVGDRVAPARLRAGHALELDVDLLRGEVGARRAIDEAAGDIGREQPPVVVDRARRSGDAQHDRQGIGLALDPGIGIDPDDHLGDRDRIGRQVIGAVGKDRIALGHRAAGPARAPR
jgi:hypothetical protein